MCQISIFFGLDFNSYIMLSTLNYIRTLCVRLAVGKR